jgi:transposase/transposase-like protein
MIEKQEIIIGYFRQGKSKRQLARELGLSKNTVKRYIAQHEDELNSKSVETGEASFSKGIVKAPKYNSGVRKKRALTKEVCQKIDEYIDQNKLKQSQGKAKQKMLGVDIHEALLRAGHRIGYTTVLRYINAKKQKEKEVFIRQHYEPGQAVEFDWAEVRLEINGVIKRLMLAVFTACYSNHRWARLYYRQDMSSFLDSHAHYFSDTGAVAQELIYDNMRVAVRKFAIRNAEKEPTEDLLKLSTYYQFDYRFCNARRGNEKGHVERSVEYVRRKAFCEQDRFETLESANQHLEQVCKRLNQLPVKGKQQSIAEDFAEELRYMKEAPPRYDTAELRTLRVDKYSCIKVDTNYYSVCEGHVGSFVTAKIYPDQIEVYDTKNQNIALHERRHTRFEYFLCLDHYLKTLRKKPGALAGSLSLYQAEQIFKTSFHHHFKNQPKDFIDLLLYMQQHGLSAKALQKAVDQCIQHCPHHPVSLDKLKILMNRPTDEKPGDTAHPKQDQGMSTHIARHCQDQLQSIQALIHNH